MANFEFDTKTKLLAITTLDGRYRDDILPLAPIVSEYGLIATRVEIEAKNVVQLCQAGVGRSLIPQERKFLLNLGPNLSLEQAEHIKQIEDTNKHDVKAMERVFREILVGTSMSDLTELIHYPLTSEDVNNLAYRLILLRSRDRVMIPYLNQLIDPLTEVADQNKDLPMLARTHGQDAVGSTFGKELVVFADRLNTDAQKLKKMRLTGKFNGAVGNYNAHVVGTPEINWIDYSKDFVKSFGLKPKLITTQINPYEDMIEMFQAFQRINGVILDFDQDMWRYISDGWLTQVPVTGEDGSSTMVQKINPIFFERSEGNSQIGTWILEGMSRKLSTSRLQRDLSDSTVIRSIGLCMGFSLLGYINAKEGFGRTHPNSELMRERLMNDFSVLGEAALTVMRRANVENPYDLMKSFTRGYKLTQEQWIACIEKLPINETEKTTLRDLTPAAYLGLAAQLTEMALADINKARRVRTKKY